MLLRPIADLVELVMTIPGVGRRTAEVLIAEVGLDMTVFPTAGHLASWAGICPGNNSSGGKRRPARTRHDILIAYYHIVRDRVPYQDLGPDWNNRRRSTEQQTRRLVRQLERLGVNVTIESMP